MIVRGRPARREEATAVLTVLEAALLDVNPAVVRTAIQAGDCLVAADHRIEGACVVTTPDRPWPPDDGDRDGDGHDGGAHVRAIAVRRARRRSGLGRRLITAAGRRWGRLTADFRGDLCGFYRACGFEVTPLRSPAVRAADESRYRGCRPAPDGATTGTRDGIESGKRTDVDGGTMGEDPERDRTGARGRD